MAVVSNFVEGTRILSARASETEVEYQVIEFPGHRRFLQLSSTGSRERQDAGTISQNLRLDRARALELVDILLRAFPT